MYRCCDKEFQDEKSFEKHIKSTRHHYLTSSESFKISLPKDYISSIIDNKEGAIRLLGFLPYEDKVIIPLRLSRNVIGGVLKRSLIAKAEGPYYDAGLINYKIDAGNIKYKISFRQARLGESLRLTIIVTFEAELNFLGSILPGAVIKSLSSIVMPDDVIENVRKALLIEEKRSITP
ncbi:C2H2-type zinc finger protein [Acidianus ambivalens]|uniref:Uncharacterized protein n=1 Tax=Acidianus ambivalens TaxID=2283 RepID=A0A650CT43_ACIAM|nr:C2H2-type zinc finger protein [Acidianus ambivalens]MQL55492.1 hypothetical protein [Acidianus ambivalens]QGR21024.1 hypothetical protein D1866_02525 [Acidianus ambivalens]